MTLSPYAWHRKRKKQQEQARLLALRLTAERIVNGGIITLESYGMPCISVAQVQALARQYLQCIEVQKE